MAIRLSDAAAYALTGDQGLRKALSNSHIVFYTGTQPLSANASIGSSQAIISFTKNDGQFTPETRAQWKFAITDTTAGDTVTTIYIGGFEILGGTVTATTSVDNDLAALVAAQINTNIRNCDFTATASTNNVTITAPKGTGTAWNLAAIVCAGSGVTFTYDPVGGGVKTSGITALNGITFDDPLNGSSLSPAQDVYYIAKPSGETWSGKNGFGPATSSSSTVFTGIVNGTTYTAGWGRIYASSSDDGSSATSGNTGYIRVDFSIGTDNADFLVSPTADFTCNTTTPIESVIDSFVLQLKKKMA